MPDEQDGAKATPPRDWEQRQHWPEGPHRDRLIRVRTRGVAVERDDDLIRSLMLELTSHGDPIYFCDGHVTSDSTPDEEQEERRRYYHLRLLADAGFLEESGRFGGNWRVTWRGHDFARMAKSDSFWADVRRTAGEQAKTRGVDFLFEIGLELMRGLLRSGGTPI